MLLLFSWQAYHHSKHTKLDDSQAVDGMDITVEEDDDDDDGDEDDDKDGDDVKCPGCSKEKEACQCKEILQTFHQTNAKL